MPITWSLLDIKCISSHVENSCLTHLLDLLILYLFLTLKKKFSNSNMDETSDWPRH